MTVGELKELLAEYSDDVEVRFRAIGTTEGTVTVVTNSWCSDEYGYDCDTEEVDTELDYDDVLDYDDHYVSEHKDGTNVLILKVRE